ncbi:MAG: methylmalonyl-CoA mutase family protein, partial [Sciscionella sp.]
MTSPPDELRLAGEFPAATRARWRELVTGVLDRMGVRPEDQQAPEQALASTTYDGITIAPLYTADDLGDIDGRVGLPGLPPFVRGSRPQGSVETGWDVRARHADPDPAATNEAALADLEHGVNSLWLLAGSRGVAVGELGTALDGVLLDLAPV